MKTELLLSINAKATSDRLGTPHRGQGFFLCISTRSPPEGLQRFLELANLVHELGENGTHSPGLVYGAFNLIDARKEHYYFKGQNGAICSRVQY